MSQTIVISSLTFQKTVRAVQLNSSSIEVRLVDDLFSNNAGGGTTPGAIQASSVSKLRIIGCTLVDNTSATGSCQQVNLTNGTTFLVNTAIYGASSSAMTTLPELSR